MFFSENSFRQEQRRDGTEKALAYYADINSSTRLHEIQEGVRPRQENEPKLKRKEKLEQQKLAHPRLYGMRTLFDFNEHFVELSNAGEEKRSLGLMLFILCFSIIALPLYSFLDQVMGHGPRSTSWFIALAIGGAMCVTVLVLCYFFAWPYLLAPAFFTSLRARYRFNRTTRKVYALRPKKYGGNVVLDWDRVQAHVRWAPPKSWTAEQLATSEVARVRTCATTSSAKAPRVRPSPTTRRASCGRRCTVWPSGCATGQRSPKNGTATVARSVARAASAPKSHCAGRARHRSKVDGGAPILDLGTPTASDPAD